VSAVQLQGCYLEGHTLCGCKKGVSERCGALGAQEGGRRVRHYARKKRCQRMRKGEVRRRQRGSTTTQNPHKKTNKKKKKKKEKRLQEKIRTNKYTNKIFHCRVSANPPVVQLPGVGPMRVWGGARKQGQNQNGEGTRVLRETRRLRLPHLKNRTRASKEGSWRGRKRRCSLQRVQGGQAREGREGQEKKNIGGGRGGFP